MARFELSYVEAGCGPDVLLLHGLGGSGLVYSRNVEELSRSHRVVALDLPGHGASADPGPPYSTSAAIDAITRFVEQELRPPVRVIGNSLGGLLAGLVSAARPDLVERVALLAAPGFSQALGWRLRLLALPLVPRLAAINSPLRTRSVLRTVLYDPGLVSDRIAREIVAQRVSASPRAIEGALRAGVGLRGMREWHNHAMSLAGICQPLLLVWGAQDRIVPVSVGRAAASLLPHASLHVLDRCGHWPQFEQPETVNRLLRDFLQTPAQTEVSVGSSLGR